MRHVIQITGPREALVALCDDGTLWCYSPETVGWAQMPPVPGQPGTPEATEAAQAHDRIALERQERAEQARRDRFQGRS